MSLEHFAFSSSLFPAAVATAAPIPILASLPLVPSTRPLPIVAPPPPPPPPHASTDVPHAAGEPPAQATPLQSALTTAGAVGSQAETVPADKSGPLVASSNELLLPSSSSAGTGPQNEATSQQPSKGTAVTTSNSTTVGSTSSDSTPSSGAEPKAKAKSQSSVEESSSSSSSTEATPTQQDADQKTQQRQQHYLQERQKKLAANTAIFIEDIKMQMSQMKQPSEDDPETLHNLTTATEYLLKLCLVHMLYKGESDQLEQLCDTHVARFRNSLKLNTKPPHTAFMTPQQQIQHMKALRLQKTGQLSPVTESSSNSGQAGTSTTGTPNTTSNGTSSNSTASTSSSSSSSSTNSNNTNKQQPALPTTPAGNNKKPASGGETPMMLFTGDSGDNSASTGSSSSVTVSTRPEEVMSELKRKYGDAISALQAGYAQSKKKKRNLSKQATDVLNNWFFNHLHDPYPTDEEKAQIAQQCSLTISQVNNWFGNKRMRYKRKMLDQARRAVQQQQQQQSGANSNAGPAQARRPNLPSAVASTSNSIPNQQRTDSLQPSPAQQPRISQAPATAAQSNFPQAPRRDDSQSSGRDN